MVPRRFANSSVDIFEKSVARATLPIITAPKSPAPMNPLILFCNLIAKVLLMCFYIRIYNCYAKIIIRNICKNISILKQLIPQYIKQLSTR